MLLPPKFCPSCRDEFLHTAAVCVQCDVALVLEENLPDESESGFPPDSELVCVRVADSGWSLGLAELLKENQIPHRVGIADAGNAKENQIPHRVGIADAGNAKQVYGVFVLPEDLEAAHALDADHARREMPDLPEGFDPREMMTGPPAEGDTLDDACPACGDALDSASEECAGCGLVLRVAE